MEFVDRIEEMARLEAALTARTLTVFGLYSKIMLEKSRLKKFGS